MSDRNQELTPFINSFSYTYNDANQRTRATLGDLSYWVYGYDSLGQVKSGKRYWFNGTPVAGQQFEYGFDDIGNRTQTKAGGDQNGANLRTNTYTANKLNQYTSRTVAGAVDVMGVALVGATVAVNGPTPAAYRKGEYFRKQLTVANTSAPVWQQVDVTATGETPVTRHELVPRTPEAFAPDADGNLLTDGRWTYTWDAENRLKQVESLASGPTASKRKVVWEFDAQGRRIRQTTYDGSSGSYVVTEDLKLVYDGWRCMAELNAANNTRLRSFVWGLDLSGSLHGAGGVGGLLLVNSVASGAHFYAYDGNGNVAALVKATDGTVSAHYEYGPFGEPIRATGTLAKENAFRFSTKRTDNTTDLVLYEYRLYNPNTGRWPSRDPYENPNPYNFVGNNALSRYDFLGLWGSDVHYAATKRWAVANSYPNDAAEVIGVADNAVDGGRTAPMPWGDQSYHFNRNLGGGEDSRLKHFETRKGNAERLCTIRTGYDVPHLAAVELGIGLHPLQDWVAHGDYGIHMTPTVWIHHNMFSPQHEFGYPGDYPDTTWLDAVGSDDGRPAGNAMRFVGSSNFDYAIFTPGIRRWTLTKEKTDKALADFRNYVRENGGCECKRYFGVD